MAAARLADVLGRDPHPLVALGREQHLLDQAAALLLGVGALRQRTPGVLDAGGQLVAQLLQLGERKQPRPAAAGDLPLEALAGQLEQKSCDSSSSSRATCSRRLRRAARSSGSVSGA